MSRAVLLHPEIFDKLPYFGGLQADALQGQADRALVEGAVIDHPDVSVLIRTQNDEEQLPTLLADIKAARREYRGDVELIVVDTESTDDTRAIAKNAGAKIVSITQ
jgi:cellulose synthase/poly-beta-1,6-N-acetylglucosamine synthase-like glycosyltransferase